MYLDLKWQGHPQVILQLLSHLLIIEKAVAIENYN